MAGKSVVSVVNQLLTDWAVPREPGYFHKANLSIRMPQRCSAEKSEKQLVLHDRVPEDLEDFWNAFSCATFFEDVSYGQWGLRILEYGASEERTREFCRSRSKDAVSGDRVIGEFIGDFELLIVRCDPSESDFGSILVALPVDPRNEWYRVASSFLSFLEEYRSNDGQKYWETQFGR